MKIAIGFYGKSDHEKNGLNIHITESKYKNITKQEYLKLLLDMSLDSIKNNLINENKNHVFELFFHTWEAKNNNYLINKLSFKDYLIEKPIKEINKKYYIKNRPKDYHCNYKYYLIEDSRLHSFKSVLNIIDKQNINYDLIIILRYDVYLIHPFILDNHKFDKNSIYTALTRLIFENSFFNSMFQKNNISEFDLSINNNINKINISKVKKKNKMSGIFYNKFDNLESYLNLCKKTTDIIENNSNKFYYNNNIGSSDFIYIFKKSQLNNFYKTVMNCSRYDRCNGSIPKYLRDKLNIPTKGIHNFFEGTEIVLTRGLIKKFIFKEKL